jgi:hypothetical protein
MLKFQHCSSTTKSNLGVSTVSDMIVNDNISHLPPFDKHATNKRSATFGKGSSRWDVLLVSDMFAISVVVVINNV